MTTRSAKDPVRWMGYEVPGDQPVKVPARDWEATKLALWRSRVAWQIAQRAAAEMVERCRHAPDCAGALSETEPCVATCPDREQRMSALVILNAARQFAPVNARHPAEQPYYAPSREYFSEVIAELAAAQAELEALRGTVITAPAEEPAKQLGEGGST